MDNLSLSVECEKTMDNKKLSVVLGRSDYHAQQVEYYKILMLEVIDYF